MRRFLGSAPEGWRDAWAAAGTTAEGPAGGSALAAGMAGAGVQPGSTSDDGAPEVPGLHPAPFDVDAT
ncbi:hypothetical protein GCM10027060_20500 [Nesterenkonia halophila]